jgi:nucleoside-diphosphate-sugar epimerase
MLVFLTGATGYIGGVVAETLIRRGHQVAGLARSQAAADKLRAIGAEPVSGDLHDPESIRRAAASADAVIHTAIEFGPDTAALDEQTVRAVLTALKGSTRPFVYTSGVWVVGDTRGRVVAELAPLRPPAIVAWRPAVEKLVIDGASDRICANVIRPAMVYGRGGGFLGGMVKQARTERLIRVVGTGENHWTYVHVDGLADLYVLTVEQAPKGEVFLASDGPAYTVRIVADTVATMYEAAVKLVPIEEARQTMGLMADALVLDQKIMTTKAGRMLGWAPRWPNVLDEIRSGSYAGQ